MRRTAAAAAAAARAASVSGESQSTAQLQPHRPPTVNSADSDAASTEKPERWTSTAGGAWLGIAMILVGCCANVMTLEIITKRDPGAGNLITFAQFLLIATEGAINHWQWPFGLAPRVVPMSVYALITSIFFVTSVLNNKALAFHISVPVHTVFRSSGLTATLLLGRYCFGVRYPRHQVIACLLVTVGIVTVTLGDMSRAVKGCCDDVGRETAAAVAVTQHAADDDGSGSSGAASPSASLMSELSVNALWLIGICMLSSALFLSAYLGHLQDRTYRTYGKQTWKEVMFYSHLLALPAFAVVSPDILHHLQLLYSLPPPVLPIAVPFLPALSTSLSPPLLLVLLCNLVTQTVCIRGVYILTTNTSTLTCSLAITARKLLSLLLSVSYFGNSWTAWQWTGTALVFVGVLAYSNNPFKEKNWRLLLMSPMVSRSASPDHATAAARSRAAATAAAAAGEQRGKKEL